MLDDNEDNQRHILSTCLLCTSARNCLSLSTIALAWTIIWVSAARVGSNDSMDVKWHLLIALILAKVSTIGKLTGKTCLACLGSEKSENDTTSLGRFQVELTRIRSLSDKGCRYILSTCVTFRNWRKTQWSCRTITVGHYRYRWCRSATSARYGLDME